MFGVFCRRNCFYLQHQILEHLKKSQTLSEAEGVGFHNCGCPTHRALCDEWDSTTLSRLGFFPPLNPVMLSGAWTSRSEVHAESKHPYALPFSKSASGSSPRAAGSLLLARTAQPLNPHYLAASARVLYLRSRRFSTSLTGTPGV